MSSQKERADDVQRISQAMDVLAKLILEKQKDGTVLLIEYQRKMKQLDRLINMILNLSQRDQNQQLVVDTNYLDKVLRDGVEVIVRTDEQNQIKKYALIPVIEQSGGGNAPSTSKSKKKKKNKIPCSFCHEIGHTRAKCEKRLLHPKEDS